MVGQSRTKSDKVGQSRTKSDKGRTQGRTMVLESVIFGFPQSDCRTKSDKVGQGRTQGRTVDPQVGQGRTAFQTTRRSNHTMVRQSDWGGHQVGLVLKYPFNLFANTLTFTTQVFVRWSVGHK